MIKIGVLTTVWKRMLVTTFHMRWMKKFRDNCKDLGIEIYPLYVLDEEDRSIPVFKSYANKHGHHYTALPTQPLSDKSQGGLEVLKDRYDLDWLMHLDSDEIISIPLIKKWKQEFEKGTKWFGSRSCFFINVSSGNAYEFKGYADHPVKNGGTCVGRELIDRVGKLWTSNKNSGLNIDERKRLEKIGYNMKPIDTQAEFGVVEIKGAGKAIHPLKWFKDRNLLTELDGRFEELISHHPMLRNLV